MLKIKTPKVDLLIVAIFFISVIFLFASVGIICYSFYFYNSTNRDYAVINEYIDKASFKTVKSSVAESIINYKPVNLDVNLTDVKNPFRIITSSEEREKITQ